MIYDPGSLLNLCRFKVRGIRGTSDLVLRRSGVGPERSCWFRWRMLLPPSKNSGWHYLVVKHLACGPPEDCLLAVGRRSAAATPFCPAALRLAACQTGFRVKLLHNVGADAEQGKPWRNDILRNVWDEGGGGGGGYSSIQQQTENTFVLIDDVPTGCQCFSSSDEHINVDRPLIGGGAAEFDREPAALLFN